MTKTQKARHTPYYSLTQIEVQGDSQDVFEVYADKSKEQTVAFVYDEKLAKNLVRAVNSHEKLILAAKCALADLRHWADGNKVDYADADRQAINHHWTEVREEKRVVLK